MNNNGTLNAVNAPIAEENLIAAELFDSSIVPEIEAIVTPANFGSIRLAEIQQVILSLFAEYDGAAFGIDVVANRLDQLGKLAEFGGKTFLRGLVASCEDPTQYMVYAQQVHNAALRRLAKVVGQTFAEDAAKAPDLNEAVSDIQKKLDDLLQSAEGLPVQTFRELAGYNRVQFIERVDNPEEIVGLRTGIDRLDRATGGLVKGQITLILAPTNGYKSTLAASACKALIEQGNGLVVSTESQPRAWLDKLVAAIARVPYDLIQTGRADYDQQVQIHEAYDLLERYGQIRMLDIGSPNADQIATAVRKAQREIDIQWVIIDSFSKLSVPGVTDIYTTSSVSADKIQDLARTVNLPFLITAQQLPEVGGRSFKMARSEDVVGGRKIAYNADVIISLYNHNMYVELQMASPDEKLPPGIILARITKHRWREARRPAAKLQVLDGPVLVQALDDPGSDRALDLSLFSGG